jgi:hypothetical protein
MEFVHHGLAPPPIRAASVHYHAELLVPRLRLMEARNWPRVKPVPSRFAHICPSCVKLYAIWVTDFRVSARDYPPKELPKFGTKSEVISDILVCYFGDAKFCNFDCQKSELFDSVLGKKAGAGGQYQSEGRP